MSCFIDYDSEIGQIRLNIGDDEEPLRLIDDILDVQLEKYPSDTSEVRVWKASLDCLNILINRAALNASRLREREGGVEIEEYRNDVYKALKERYDDLVANPPVDASTSEATLIVIGGVSKKETTRITNNLDNKRPSVGIGWFDSDKF